MSTYLDNADEIEVYLGELGIPTNYPGFYDHPNFLEREAIDKNFLNYYASYVRQLKHEESYLGEARSTITRVSEILHHELVKDGRQGACIDTSMVFSRILDQEGIWNYMVKGALAITFPRESGIPDLYLWPVDQGIFDAGHVWISAPPFEIVDITLKYQSYDYEADRYLPDVVLADEVIQSRAREDEIFSPEARVRYQLQGIQVGFLIAHILPYLGLFWSKFPPGELEEGKVKLKYIPTGISASDGPLEKITSLQLSNKTGIEIYEDIIQPQLRK